jgi:glycosyltransferase involved in cell wall biosynthesis
MSHDLAFRMTAPSPIRVSVVFPCLNEQYAVGRCVHEAHNALEAAGYLGEVIVVDNNSTDDSARVAREAGAHVIRETTPGYGSALRAGFRSATGDIIVMADADATYPIESLDQLIGPVVAGDADIVVGARLDAATSASMPFTHR